MSASTARDFSRSWWKEAIKRRVVQMHQAGLAGGQLHAAYLAQLGMAEEQISQGYDVVDNQHFADGAEDARRRADATRQALDLPEDYFLTSCRFVEKKNLQRLLRAYALYRGHTEVPWDLVLLGDGPLRGNLSEQAEAHGISNHVHFPGFKQYDELPPYYGLANGFVLASTTEQWGLVVNEAMAAGLPVLVSERCGCASDLVREGKNGFTFDPYDPVEIARLMGRMAGKRCDRSAMGARSQAIISQWTPERFADGLLAAAEKAKSAVTNHSGTVADTSLLWLLQRISG
jgi:glycosyltransferase involved in cell wall biosynthesis